MLTDTTKAPGSSPDPTPAAPLGKLTDPERLRRVRLANRAKDERERHAEAKVTWSKTWKRKDEAFAELIDRLMREADTGWDEGQQLSIPGTEPELPPDPTPEPSPPSRWDELARVEPPRLTVWTLQEADLSPVAARLLERLTPGESLELGDLSDLLGCSAAESLDAVAELLCFGLATLRDDRALSAVTFKEGMLRLRLDGWRDDNEGGPGLAVLHEMLRTEIDGDVHPDCLLIGSQLPRRALLPLLEGLKALGTVTSTEKGWRRVARVPLWEGLVLEALARAEGVVYLAKGALTGCLDFDWTIGGLVEAGVIKRGPKSVVTGLIWQIVDEADRRPLSLEDVVAMVKRKAPKEGSKEAAPLQRIADDLDLQAPIVRRACDALVAEGWLVEASAPKGYQHYFGPWYKRAGDKAPKGKKKDKGGKAASKGKAQPKNTAKHGKKDMLAQKRVERREEEGRTQYRIRPVEPESSAQDRTLPLLEGVEPAPARDALEASPPPPTVLEPLRVELSGDLRSRVIRALEDARVRRSTQVLATLLGAPEDEVQKVLDGLVEEDVVLRFGQKSDKQTTPAYELLSKWESRRSRKGQRRPSRKASGKEAE